MQLQRIASLAEVSAQDWNALLIDEDPFVRHEFLAALEQHGCVGAESGWTPCHLLLTEGGVLRGAVPLYVKDHSWGEFVFDWNWAQALERAGAAYYPKLLSAVPFTPTTGARLLVGRGADAQLLRATLAHELTRFAATLGVSGVHVNFNSSEDQAALEAQGFLARHDCRFLWHNHGYRVFEDFLAGLRAEKRKKLRRERRKVAEAGITFRSLAGENLDDDGWATVFGFSQRTFLRHGNGHYLTAAFLADVARRLPGCVLVELAELAGRPIAAAIFFRSRERLYGRYWGADGEHDSLHFEACYYRGIELCIREGIACFDPGTQGEHKLLRGFEPSVTYSAHWLVAGAFRQAIARYLVRERAGIAGYIDSARQHLPFRRDGQPGEPGVSGEPAP